eukprot:6194524-Pleurochrysis_carterae.AAC.1
MIRNGRTRYVRQRLASRIPAILVRAAVLAFACGFRFVLCSSTLSLVARYSRRSCSFRPPFVASNNSPHSLALASHSPFHSRPLGYLPLPLTVHLAVSIARFLAWPLTSSTL